VSVTPFETAYLMSYCASANTASTHWIDNLQIPRLHLEPNSGPALAHSQRPHYPRFFLASDIHRKHPCRALNVVLS